MRKNTFRSIFLAIILSIIPVAYSYTFPFLINNFGHALFVFVAFPLMIIDSSENSFRGLKRSYCKPYLWFSFYLVFITLVAPLTLSYEVDTLGVFITSEFAITILFLISNTKLSHSFVEVYTIFAVLFSIFLIIQYLAYMTTGAVLSGQIPFLETYEREVGGVFEGRLLRLTSVFAEPSHFSVYVVPAILMYLMERTEQKFVLVKVCIITTAVLLSTSSNGLIAMLLAYAAFVLHKYFSKIKIGHIIIGCVILFGAYYFLTQSEYIADVTYGLFVKQEGQSVAKAENRVYRGFLMFADLPLDRQIFGVGYKASEDYCRACAPTLLGKYSYDVFDYYNSVAGTLIYSGIIGFICLVNFFVAMFRYTRDYLARALIVIVFILMSSSSILLTDQWIFFLATIISCINIGKEEDYFNNLNPKLYISKQKRRYSLKS